MEIPEGFAQVNFRFTGANAPTGAEVTLGLDVDTFAGTVTEAAEAARDAWVDNVIPQQTSSITLANVLVKYGPNSTGEAAEVSAGNAGAISGAAEVPSAAVLVNKVTGFGGRTGRGRMFVPGFNGAIFDSSGIISSGDLAGIQSAFNAFRGDLLGVNLIPVLLHGADSPVSAPMPITSFTVTNKAATQRRRLRR